LPPAELARTWQAPQCARVSLTELKLVWVLVIEASMVMRRNTRHDEINT
jgi:hypothetical protein